MLDGRHQHLWCASCPEVGRMCGSMASHPASSVITHKVHKSYDLEMGGDNKVDWHYIDPGQPQQNAFIESFNSSLRDELLNEEIFDTLDDARRKLALWRYDYNNVRPHSSLGNKTSAEARRALEELKGSAHDARAQNKTEVYKTQNSKLSLWIRKPRGAGH